MKILMSLLSQVTMKSLLEMTMKMRKPQILIALMRSNQQSATLTMMLTNLAMPMLPIRALELAARGPQCSDLTKFNTTYSLDNLIR